MEQFLRFYDMFYLIQHVPEEGAGVFEQLLPSPYKTILTIKDSFPDNFENISGVLIMGGPMGVYERSIYPFIEKELAFIKKCYEKNVKVLGVCLGAQMIAEALGGKVYKGHIQEVGWCKIMHTKAAKEDALFSIFPEELDVFQWHGDTFDLPPDAIRLAVSKEYENQAFRVGKHIYGLQYHIEVTDKIIKEWFPQGYQKFVYPEINRLNSLAMEAFGRFLRL